ncbi:MAG: WD40 repeat domain-containing protein [Pirellulaceae bacterium]
MAIPTTFKLLKDHSRQEIFFDFARLPSSNRLFLGASDGKVYDVDVLAEKPEWKTLEGHSSYVTGVALASGNQTLVSGGYDGKLIWRKVENGEVIRMTEAAHSKWIRKVIASPDGKRVVSIGDDMFCRVWDAETGNKLHELKGHEEKTPNHFPSMLYAACISADNRLLATGDKVGHVVIWDLAAGSKLATLEVPGLYTWDPKQRIHSIGGIRSLAFSPDGKSLAVGGIGHIGNIDHLDGPARVELFAWEKNEKLHEFLGDGKGLITSLVFGPDGKWLLGAGGDNGGLTQLYDLESKKVAKSEKAPMHIHAVALAENSETLFACGHHKVAVFELKAA